MDPWIHISYYEPYFYYEVKNMAMNSAGKVKDTVPALQEKKTRKKNDFQRKLVSGRKKKGVPAGKS